MKITLNELKQIVRQELKESMYGEVDTNESLEALLDSTVEGGTFKRERLVAIFGAIAGYYKTQSAEIGNFKKLIITIQDNSNRIPDVN